MVVRLVECRRVVVGTVARLVECRRVVVGMVARLVECRRVVECHRVECRLAA
jgi:hypothetical protein